MTAELGHQRPGMDPLRSQGQNKHQVETIKHTDYDQWQRKGRSRLEARLSTRGEEESKTGSSTSRPESMLDFSKLPIQMKSSTKFSVGPACNHKHGRAKSAVHDGQDEKLAKERQKEMNVLSLLILARQKALESYKLREETLLNENSKLRLEIENSEKNVHKEVKDLLKKYERYRGAVSTLTTKFESQKETANRQLQQVKDKISHDLQGLQKQVDKADGLLAEKKKELATLTSYKDKEYPVRAMRIRELHKQIKYLAKEFKAEQDELEKIIGVEVSKYTQHRDERLQEIQSNATDMAQDMMQEGIKDMALQNITMKREIEDHIGENAEIEDAIKQLAQEVEALQVDPKTNVRKQMFPHLYKDVTKCTPEMVVVLDIPRHDWLPV